MEKNIKKREEESTATSMPRDQCTKIFFLFENPKNILKIYLVSIVLQSRWNAYNVYFSNLFYYFYRNIVFPDKNCTIRNQITPCHGLSEKITDTDHRVRYRVQFITDNYSMLLCPCFGGQSCIGIQSADQWMGGTMHTNGSSHRPNNTTYIPKMSILSAKEALIFWEAI